jgi:ATP-dependent RNA helicase RhlE
MPAEIADLAAKMLHDPVTVAVTPVASTVEKVAQRVIHVDKASKSALLAETLREDGVNRAIVFTRTKHGADKVVRSLQGAKIDSEAIHGNKSQPQRERALAAFKSGQIRVLIATDIAARGIDVDGISHVINYDLPEVPETYVHRIGRTARAGATGQAIAFCDHEERHLLRAIERLIKLSIPATGRASELSARPERAERGYAPRTDAVNLGENPRREGAVRDGSGRPPGGRPKGGRPSGGRPGGGGKPFSGRPGGGGKGRGFGGGRPQGSRSEARG